MKKLVSLFLWTCAATVIAQGCILTLSFLRGNLNKDTMTSVIAMINGIDIQTERIRKAYVSAQNAPVPAFEDIAAERAKLSLEFDSRESFLNRQKQENDNKLIEIRDRENRFEARRVEFFNELAELGKKAETSGILENQRFIEVLAPEKAKSMLLMMKKDGEMRAVVTIIKGMTDEKRKKIAAEFTAEEDTELSEILAELRKGDPEASLIKEAQDGQKSGAP